MAIVIYPGTFDPLTKGHVDIVTRAVALFETVVIAVAKNTQKQPYFSLKDRLTMCKETFLACKQVQVDSFDGLLTDFLKRKNAKIILRGLRNTKDLNTELSMSSMNRLMMPECDTLFMPSSDKTFFISSTMVKEILSMQGDVSPFVPSAVEKRLERIKYGT